MVADERLIKLNNLSIFFLKNLNKELVYLFLIPIDN